MLDRAPAGEGRARIVVPMLSRIANFDEFDALRAEPGVEFAFAPPGQALPGDADLVILPGTKATIADLAFLRAQGWDVDIAAHARRVVVLRDGQIESDDPRERFSDRLSVHGSSVVG